MSKPVSDKAKLIVILYDLGGMSKKSGWTVDTAFNTAIMAESGNIEIYHMFNERPLPCPTY